jgi:hypothetical protein
MPRQRRRPANKNNKKGTRLWEERNDRCDTVNPDNFASEK